MFRTVILAATLVVATLSLSACAPDLSALSGDPATVGIHSVVQGPMWTITTDITRVNSTNTAASAGTTGTTVNVPTGSVVNPGQAKGAVQSSTSTLSSALNPGTTIEAPLPK